MIRVLRNISLLALVATVTVTPSAATPASESPDSCSVIPFCDGRWVVYDSCSPETCNDVLIDCVMRCGAAPFSFECSPSGGSEPADHGVCMCTDECEG